MRQHFGFSWLTGSEGSEYLKIAGARRLAVRRSVGLARLAQEASHQDLQKDRHSESWPSSRSSLVVKRA